MVAKSIFEQYKTICCEAIQSVLHIQKPLKKVLFETMMLYVAIFGKINFL